METFASMTVDGQRVYGMLHTPDTPAPVGGHPSVLMLHGFTGSRSADHRLFPLLSRYLVRLGIASLRIDFRGSGDSEGDFSEMTVTREVEDAHAAMAYLRRQPGIDPERAMLLGFSLGGMVAALAAPDVRPHRLALWAPALPEVMLPHLRGGLMPSAISDFGGWPLGRAFLQELPRLKPLEAAGRWGGVARVFHGDADRSVPPEMGVRYARALGCDAVGIPGANHTFDSLGAVEMLHRETARFLAGD
ncbi:alpha/beta hydrolase family protein [Deinococcus maricopensis]|uniref:Hydrolase, putative n=1 Tax=Deinococcus maricopensis (strain DSM 21211 / LMG 22137 / NRRL B-23946 / LB-34) TaxID=709986 RepID=E8U8E7_DEIML|nr:alpha/beta fold hydrolase [Deinococcus maricopensis]ADV67336.1 hydrolase, putative [Deinococcus maricopensis DSM 21211]